MRLIQPCLKRRLRGKHPVLAPWPHRQKLPPRCGVLHVKRRAQNEKRRDQHKELNDQPIRQQSPNIRWLARPKRLPEPSRPKTPQHRLKKGIDVPLGMMLKEIWMKPPFRIQKLRPRKPVSAFRTSRLDKPAKVVPAKRTQDFFANGLPIGRRGGKRSNLPGEAL